MAHGLAFHWKKEVALLEQKNWMRRVKCNTKKQKQKTHRTESYKQGQASKLRRRRRHRSWLVLHANQIRYDFTHSAPN